jgi:peptidoglycan-associated lipoprotein
MRSTIVWLGKGATLLFLSFALLGCPPKKKPIAVEAPAETAAEAPAEEAAPLDQPALEVGTDWASVPRLEPVYFDYNKADLRPEARAALKQNAAVLKAVHKSAPSVTIRAEGHCDERGTLEYNLALGQRRANAVSSYYASLGISRRALSTISYGEERPVCSGADESCWSRNRRGETTLKASEPVRIPLDQLP